MIVASVNVGSAAAAAELGVAVFGAAVGDSTRADMGWSV